ncbi:MAG: tetratricopeptide repeat protein [Saprospiraceae bacterium]|nr:tetratricopeptide repeat protein [Saprospiraceae bacterium]
MKYLSLFIVALLGMTFGCANERESTNLATITPAELCGTVQFSDGCSDAIDSLIAYGLALVHHMTYEEAESVFDTVIARDPDCFWGHWGKALTYFHPMWPDRASEEKLKHGQVLIARARGLASKKRERQFADAVGAYYGESTTTPEPERLASYEEGWRQVYAQRPEDMEAKAFYALSMVCNAPRDDKTYARNLEAGRMAEEIIEVIPDHPGGFHYAIHAYDVPALAERAIDVANQYGKIAPSIPHALHMPTHIFTQEGMWNESIEWNARSAAEAARRVVEGARLSSAHQLHALDYMVYAYLQLGQLESAKAILDEVRAMEYVNDNAASAYAVAAIPARIALETRNWQSAATLELMHQDQIAWEKYPQYEALHHFARALGAARTQDIPLALSLRDTLDKIYQGLLEKPEHAYWADQVLVKKDAIDAWIALGQGKPDDAIARMQESATLEGKTDKNPVSPGEILPAFEMLGDLYLEMKNPEQALAAYERSLEGAANRLNTYFGAGLACQQLGKESEASAYFSKVVGLAEGSQMTQVEVAARGG